MISLKKKRRIKLEKVVVKTPKYVTVQKGFKEIVTYKTLDGAEFNSERDAISHEKNLALKEKLKNISCRNSYNEIDDASFYGDLTEANWYYIKDENDIKILHDCFPCLKQSTGKLQVGAWNLVTKSEYESSGYSSCSGISYCIYSKEEVKNKINSLTEMIDALVE